jgi:tryptophan synthase alpha chain
MSRLSQTFSELKAQNRAAFLPFVTGGDPDAETSLCLLEGLPSAGADVIELGIPFSDPMADGPINQASYLRALKAGASLQKLLDLVKRFRKGNARTPVVLMGAFNPIHAFGSARFARAAADAGVDGLLVVDLPAEEDEVLRAPAREHGVDVIRFLAPTTHDARLKTVLDGAGGYLYYASIAGITGTKSYIEDEVRQAVERIKRATVLPCAVGFGIRTPEQAGRVARFADAVVVGSSIVSRIEQGLSNGAESKAIVSDVLSFCRQIAESVHSARLAPVVQ